MTDPTTEFVESIKRAGEEARKQQASDLAAGHARIGGLFAQPDYLDGYLQSGALLAKHGQETGKLNEFAIVCVYLQRHALELLIKSLSGLFYEIAEARDALAEIEHKQIQSTKPSESEKKRFRQEHNLRLLLQDLRRAWQREADANRKYLEVPSELEELVNELSLLEEEIPEKFRYPDLKLRTPRVVHIRTPEGSRKETTNRRQSFEGKMVIPVIPLQRKLESIVDQIWGSGDEIEGTISSLGFELAQDSNRLFQELYYLGGLEELIPAPEVDSPR